MSCLIIARRVALAYQDRLPTCVQIYMRFASVLKSANANEKNESQFVISARQSGTMNAFCRHTVFK